MKARKVLNKVISTSGMNKSALSRSMGKGDNYLSVTVSRGSVPQADTFAMIADASGYDLLVRNRSSGTETKIDPPDEYIQHKRQAQ